MALTDKLSAIGNAIREKTGKEDLLTLDQMPGEIEGINVGSLENSKPSEIVIATSCSNARQVYELFAPMANKEALLNIWAFKGDASATGVNNKLVYLMIHDYDSITPVSIEGTYVRYRDNAYKGEINFSTNYDLYVSPGDTFLHWALKP